MTKKQNRFIVFFRHGEYAKHEYDNMDMEAINLTSEQKSKIQKRVEELNREGRIRIELLMKADVAEPALESWGRSEIDSLQNFLRVTLKKGLAKLPSDLTVEEMAVGLATVAAQSAVVSSDDSGMNE